MAHLASTFEPDRLSDEAKRILRDAAEAFIERIQTERAKADGISQHVDQLGEIGHFN